MSMFENIISAFAPGGNQGVQQRRADIDATKQLTRQRAEQAAQQEQDAEDRHAQFDLGLHNQLISQFAKPIVNGMVREDYSDIPGFSGAAPTGEGPTGEDTGPAQPASPGFRLRPATTDKSRIIAFDDHKGGGVSYERPTETERRLLENQQATANASAIAQGTASGRSQGEQESRDRVATPVTEKDQQTYGLPPDMRLTPSDRVTLASKVIPVVTRVAGQTNIAGMNNDARADRQQASIAAKASGVKSTHVTVGPGGAQSLLAIYNNGETEESPMDAAAAVKSGAPTPGQQGVMSRFQQRFQANDAKAHEALQSKEQGLWAQHAALGDVLSTPDGQTFVDPTSKSGKEVQMNYAQRLVMKNRYQAAEDAAKQAQQGAANIRQKWGWGEFAPVAQQAAPPNGAPAQSAQSAPPPSTPRAGAAPAQPAPLLQSAPVAAAPPVPATAGANGPTTVRPFKIGQTVWGKDGKAHRVSGYDNAGKVLVD